MSFSPAAWLIFVCFSLLAISPVKANAEFSSGASIESKTQPVLDPQKLFLQAEAAIDKKQYSLAEKLLAQMGDYPLAPYIQRGLLLKDLSLANTADIEAFLLQYENQAVSRKLRYKWLNRLAKDKHSSLFLRHYQPLRSSSLACREIEFRLKTAADKAELYQKIEKRWMSRYQLPRACLPMVNHWQKAGFMTQDLIWSRMLMAVNANKMPLAKKLYKKLKYKNQSAGQLLLKIAKAPDSLDRVNFRLPLTIKAKDIIALGLHKLAWKNPNQAISIYQYLENQFQLTEKFAKVDRAIGLSLAINKDPKAPLWLEGLPAVVDDSVDQWRLATALHHKDWQGLVNFAEKRSKQSLSTDKWFYWQAMATAQLGEKDKAKQLLKNIAENRSYYGFLAASELNQAADLKHQSIDFNPVDLQIYKNSPAAKRAKAFFDLGRAADARREWNQLVSNTLQEEQTKLAYIAHSWGWQHQSILAFARSKQINDVAKRFPLHHYPQFSQESQQNNIPMSWAYAITRQESAFKTDAVSSAGARGLMQLTPATARYVSGNKKAYANPAKLLNADTNIKLGTAYLSQMYQSFDSHPILATAAYNAGRSKVLKWLTQTTSQDPIHWIEQIPYKETREYVKNVLTYQLIYARLSHKNDDFIASLGNFPIFNSTQTQSARR